MTVVCRLPLSSPTPVVLKPGHLPVDIPVITSTSAVVLQSEEPVPIFYVFQLRDSRNYADTVTFRNSDVHGDGAHLVPSQTAFSVW